MTLCTPARLADLMYRNQFDAGLVPVAEVLLHDQYDILDGIAIAARGPVRSVFLAHREPIEKLKRIAVDPASRTSVWLLRVLLKIGYHIEPEFYPRPERREIERPRSDDADWRRGDLVRDAQRGAAGVGFGRGVDGIDGVAVRVCGVGAADGTAVNGQGAASRLLREAKADGLAHIEQIVQDATEATPEFLREYYTRHVWYELGEAEKQGSRGFSST